MEFLQTEETNEWPQSGQWVSRQSHPEHKSEAGGKFVDAGVLPSA
jgi:hypothetical protein